MLFKYCLICFCCVCMLASCSNKESKTNLNDSTVADGHPAWILQGNVYEVNVRQYTPEGTFKAFATHLPRLKEMGVQTLWFMPISPISKTDRKGTLGSYYAASHYYTINPEFGTLADWKSLVAQCHSLGFKVIIDWVANHTGADHYWLQQYPDFYVRDSVTGKALSQFDWTDTRKLNFNNPVVGDSMIAAMQYWIRETDIDGYRCDVAGEVPDAFWTRCIAQLRKEKNLFMLAEGDKPELHQDGFDATYAWSDFSMMKMIASGKRNAQAYDSVRLKTDSTFPANALRFYFTSNHDENSWNKADFETMPGASHAPFALLTQTMHRSLPMIYSGQEEPILRAIPFFEKDSMRFDKLERAPFYKKLLALRKSNPALAANASFTKLSTGNDAVYAYYRKSGKQFVLVILNLSNQVQTFNIRDEDVKDIQREAVRNVMDGTTMKGVPNGTITLQPWAYRLIE